MAQQHENCPILLSVIREFGNCAEGLAQDCILTRVTTCSPKFGYRVFNSENAFKTYNDQVGCYSQVHEIECDTSSLVYDRVKTYALEKRICHDDLQEQQCFTDPLRRIDLESRALNSILNSLRLKKEIRIWQDATNPANFTTGNLTSWSGRELDAPGSTTNPLFEIRDIIAGMPSGSRPNWAVIPRAVQEKLIRHPAFFGEGCCNVLNPLDVVTSMLGLTGICVADAQADFSAIGLPADVQNIFPNSILLYRRNDSFTDTECPAGTFAFEAVYRPFQAASEFRVYRLSGTEQNWDMGLDGGLRIKAGYSSAIKYNYDLAHLITDVCI